MTSTGTEGSERGIERDALWSMVSYLLNRISHRYNKNVHAELKAIGLTTLNVRIIASLEALGPLTIKELCIHAIAEQPTMSRALDRLEKEDVVAREFQEADARTRVVKLMPKGRAMYERIMPVLLNANDDLLAGLQPDEQKQLMSLLTRVLTQIRRNPV